MIKNDRSNLTGDQRAEIVRRGNIRLHTDVALQLFESDGAGGPWTPVRSTVQFLHSGKGDQYDARSGITATEDVVESLTTLENAGFPSRQSHFCVTGLGFDFSKPFDATVTGTGANRTSTLDGPDAELVEDLGAQLIRACLFGADVRYVLDDECTQLLGPMDQFPSGLGLYDAADLPTLGVPMESSARQSLRDHAIILPMADPKNRDRNVIRVTFSGLRTVPIDPDLAVPAVAERIALPIRLSLEGFYCNANGEPIDEYEGQIAQPGMAA